MVLPQLLQERPLIFQRVHAEMKQDGFGGSREEAMAEHAKRAQPMVCASIDVTGEFVLNATVKSSPERALQGTQVHCTSDYAHPACLSATPLRWHFHDARTRFGGSIRPGL